MKQNKNKNKNQKKKYFSAYEYKLQVPGILRLLFALLLFFLELGIFAYISVKISKLGLGFLLLWQIAALIFTIYLSQKPQQTSYVHFWIMLILFFPPLGFILYFVWGRDKRFPKKEQQFKESLARRKPFQKSTKEALGEVKDLSLNMAAKRQLGYFCNYNFPVYQNCNLTYFRSGEAQYKQMFKDISEAKDYIFLEVFIVADGYIWEKTVDLLIRKAQEGVEIRLLLDDFGTIAKMDWSVINKLKKNKIKFIRFNPVIRYASGLYQNYRNHKKSCLIDGKIAWLGSANLGDEYVNLISRFGYWKDNALRIEGEACRSILLDFLLLWEHEREFPLDEDYSKFIAQVSTEASPENKGLLVPFWNGPLGSEEKIAIHVINSVINTATEKLIISTPYLILEDSIAISLCQAAKSGIDVNIILPDIPDKPLVYLISQSNYGNLLKAGCRIYQYKPGFIHAKTLLADGEIALMGSINLDYRSLYLNFENGIYIYKHPVIEDMYQDYENILANCREILLEEWEKRPLWKKIVQFILRPFSPLI